MGEPFYETRDQQKEPSMDERIGTICVQGGWRPGDGEPRQVPIYQNTTWKYDTSEHMGRLFDLEESGYFYTRLANPTNDAVAAKIAALEGGAAAMLTSFGPGGELLRRVQHCRRGRSRGGLLGHLRRHLQLFAHTMARMGLECTFVDPHCTDEELAAAFRPNTKCVFGETIANPALSVLDIERFAAAAHDHGVPLIVDNTFPTPVLCRPIEWGADIVTHSTTKYMDGHGASVGGVIVDAAPSTGTPTLTSSPGSPSPTRATMAWCTPSVSAWKARSSPRPQPSSCAIWVHPGAAERLHHQPGSGEPASAHGPARRQRACHRRALGRAPEGVLGAPPLA